MQNNKPDSSVPEIDSSMLGKPDIKYSSPTPIDNTIEPCSPAFLANLSDLPRFDLREAAFRKYERYIVRAYLEGTYTLNLRDELIKREGRSVTPHTWVCRFRDAIIGFMRYKYDCADIPMGTDLSYIKAREQESGFVRVVNSRLDAKLASGAIHARDWNKVLSICQEFEAIDTARNGNLDSGPPKIQRIAFTTEEEKLKLLALPDKFGGIWITCGPEQIAAGVVIIKV